MLSRALSLATVTLLVGCLTAGVARAAENLDAGKSPSQIFSNTCSACHKSPRGLLKTTPASSLPGFLRQHYTTGTEMASVLSSYLISNGAADPRYQSKDQPRKDARQDRRQQDGRLDGRPDQPERAGRRPPTGAPAQEATRPVAGAARPQGEGGRQGREGRRYGRPRVAPDAAQPADGQAPVQAATDSKPVGRQKQGRRGRPVPAEPPKTEQVAPAAKDDDASSRRETGAIDSVKSGTADPAADTIKVDSSNSDTTITKIDSPKESTGGEANPLRPEPASSAASAPPVSAAVSPDSSTSNSPVTPPVSSPPETATVPSAPAGPPVPPISR
jgi:hypothetical protein